MTFLRLTAEYRERNNSTAEEALETTVRRLLPLSAVATAVHLLHIIMFLPGNPSGNSEAVWKQGILLSHTALAAWSIILFYLLFIFRKHNLSLRFKLLLKWTTVFIFVLAGAVITAFDQLVTVSITPYMVVSIITAFLFLIRPFHSVILYTFFYFLFSSLIGLTQTDPSVLLSNRVNGITITGIAVSLSIVLWNANTARILAYRLIRKQNEELEIKNKELAFLAAYDSLTGLYNRRQFELIMLKEVSLLQRYNNPGSLVIMDIDHFKNVNDSFGHPAGDYVITTTGNIIHSVIRTSDILSRWGGEEFLIYLPRTTLDGALVTAEKIRNAVQEHRFEYENRNIRISLSAGVCQLNLKNNHPLVDAYQKADQALIQAKKNGRNQIVALMDPEHT